MPTVVSRAGRAGMAGALIAAGIGLGACNAWWMAAFIGIPLILTGLLVVPRSSRTSGLTRFASGTASLFVPARIEALTRSTLADADQQPTLVTATISPANDTSYQARWVTSMSRNDFESLTKRPDTALPPEGLPPREPKRTADFRDHPGKRAVGYPAITVLTTWAVLLGVGDAWQVSIRVPSISASVSAPTKTADLDARRANMLRVISERLGPGAADNLLDLRFADGGSDYATVFNPANGEATSVYIAEGRDVHTSPTSNRLRKSSTFTAEDVATIPLATIADRMAREFHAVGNDAAMKELRIQRTGPTEPLMLTGTFDAPSAFAFPTSVEARPDGTVAALFDPADFAAALRSARQALDLAGVGASDPVLSTLQIRGIAANTPLLHAGRIQNSGGGLIEFGSDGRTGEAVVVPGQFPVVTSRSYRTRGPGFRFDDISPAVFESVRAQAMRRGSLEPYESRAVDIEMSDNGREELGLVIRIQLAGVDAASGTYSPAGRFIKQGTR
ncbi:hypothetical protein [Mycobacterium sp. UM_Kg1]|uniref:hypothetical protein n=1 Tax=Mycobacterium sp. UM_Kg1 TaxID=1545691 RepID=UPI00061AA2E3|nr:hypothetical protein [Mycobacterium sp. UM_Kg1]